MPAYDSIFFQSPAPMALVTVRSLEADMRVPNVPMLIDSGASVSLLTRSSIAKLLNVAQVTQQVELEGFDGTKSWAPVIHLELFFLGKSFRGQFALIDEEVTVHTVGQCAQRVQVLE